MLWGIPKSKKLKTESTRSVIVAIEPRVTHKTLIAPLAHPPNALFPISVYPNKLRSVNINLANSFALLISTGQIFTKRRDRCDSRMTCDVCEAKEEADTPYPAGVGECEWEGEETDAHQNSDGIEQLDCQRHPYTAIEEDVKFFMMTERMVRNAGLTV